MAEALTLTDPLVVVPLIGGFVGMAVGLVTIWSTVKGNRDKSKTDFENSNIALESRLKEYFELKFSKSNKGKNNRRKK